MQLNVNIKLIRELSGKTQPQFAEIVGTNLSNLKTYETTDVRPKANILAAIADYAGISVADLENNELTHKNIRIKSKKYNKSVSREVGNIDIQEPIPSYGDLDYQQKYIALLEKENAKKDEIISISLNELVVGQRISQAHLKTLLQITVVETAAIQGKDPSLALNAANKVVADNFSAIVQTGTGGS